MISGIMSFWRSRPYIQKKTPYSFTPIKIPRFASPPKKTQNPKQQLTAKKIHIVPLLKKNRGELRFFFQKRLQVVTALLPSCKVKNQKRLGAAINPEGTSCLSQQGNTVDGRNPAPPGMYETL